MRFILRKIEEFKRKRIAEADEVFEKERAENRAVIRALLS